MSKLRFKMSFYCLKQIKKLYPQFPDHLMHPNSLERLVDVKNSFSGDEKCHPAWRPYSDPHFSVHLMAYSMYIIHLRMSEHSVRSWSLFTPSNSSVSKEGTAGMVTGDGIAKIEMYHSEKWQVVQRVSDNGDSTVKAVIQITIRGGGVIPHVAVFAVWTSGQGRKFNPEKNHFRLLHRIGRYNHRSQRKNLLHTIHLAWCQYLTTPAVVSKCNTPTGLSIT